MAGTLYVVATPIGNLQDLTFRALQTLRDVQLVAAEDTRRTAKLLAHYDVHTSVVSLREHNEARETPRLLARLANGEDIALVSDAGTPAISDPGARFVRAARDRHIRVVPVPGASAVAAVLSAAGVPADQFVFLGYPPSSGHARQRWMEALGQEERTAVFFEAPHRIRRTMAEVATACGKRPIVLGHELTKFYETLVDWPTEALPEKGEFTVVVGPSDPSAMSSELADHEIVQAMGCLTDIDALTPVRAQELVAHAFGVPTSRVRKALKLDRYARKEAARNGEP